MPPRMQSIPASASTKTPGARKTSARISATPAAKSSTPSSPLACRACMACPAAPTPGKMMPCAASAVAGSDVTTHGTPKCSNARRTLV